VIQVQWKLPKQKDFNILINGSFNQNRRSLRSNVSGGFGHKYRRLLVTRWRCRRKSYWVILVPGIFSATFFGRAASGGALAPEPPRATRSQPEFLGFAPKTIIFAKFRLSPLIPLGWAQPEKCANSATKLTTHRMERAWEVAMRPKKKTLVEKKKGKKKIRRK